MLDGEYLSRTASARIMLKARLFHFQISLGEPIRSELARFDELVRKLEAIGSPVEDEDAAIALMNGLPNSFANLKTALGLQEKLKLRKVKEVLMEELMSKESKVKVKKEVREAGVFWARGEEEESKCYYCGKTGHVIRFCEEKFMKEMEDRQTDRRKGASCLHL